MSFYDDFLFIIFTETMPQCVLNPSSQCLVCNVGIIKYYMKTQSSGRSLMKVH